MNNSVRKSNLTNLLNNLSETSNDFLSEINQNLKNKILFGGGTNCPCVDALKAFNAENYDLGLYILKDKNCCNCCKDENGNTILHHLVLCCTVHNNNNKCVNVLSHALRQPHVSEFINLQNDQGTTAILMAVENENDFIANKLEEAGADKTISDNNGNYLQSDVSENINTSVIETPNEKVCINNVLNLVVGNKKEEPELSSLNLSSIIDNSNKSVNIDTRDYQTDEIKERISKEFGLTDKTEELSSLGLSSSDNYLDSDKFIQFLSNKYGKELPKSIDELMGNTEQTDDILNNITKKITNELNKNVEPVTQSEINTDSLNTDSLNTETLMNAIDNIKSNNKINVMEGGAKEKLMGYRKINLNSDNSDNIYERINANFDNKNSKLKKYSKQSNELSINLDLYYSDGESGVSNNELSRLINSRKNELHNEVINMIMGMLNKGTITKNSKPIEASERNAKLIKSFLYRVVSEKNPQLTGMDKILMIKKMNDKEIIDMLSKMPDLDELEENIRKHIEEKQKQHVTNSSEDSEKPKKKSKKAEQSRVKRVSKKSSKKSSKKTSKKSSRKSSRK